MIGRDAVLDREVREGFSEEMALEQRCEGSEGESNADNQGRVCSAEGTAEVLRQECAWRV